MGHKVHPKVFRLNTVFTWDSKWFARGRQFVAQLQEDVEIRTFLRAAIKDAGLNDIAIERTPKQVVITLRAAKPGVIIGRQGAGIEDLKKRLLAKFYRGRRVTLNVNVQEIANPSLAASVVGQQIAQELEKRMPFRRSMKMAIERVMKAGAKGVKITVSGRLNGAEIARTETLSQGSIPLHNLRADIDFARERANTVYGVIGIKMWIYRGDVFGTDHQRAEMIAPPTSERDHRSGDRRGGRRPNHAKPRT